MSDTPSLQLRWAQGEVFSSRKRFRVLVAGRRFGKSYLSCIELLRGAIERPGETFFYCAPTYRMAKDIAWKALKRLGPPRLDQVQKRNRPQTGASQRQHHRIEGRRERNGAPGPQFGRRSPRRGRLHGLGGLVRGHPPRPRRQTRLGPVHFHPGRHRQLVLRPLVLLRRSRRPQLGPVAVHHNPRR
jgi:hypothetical protein